MVAALGNGVLKGKPLLSGANATTNYTVADVYSLVKQYDQDFAPNSVFPQMLNPNGTPKKLFHGTDADFSEFAPGLSGGIYLADNRNVAENFTKSGRVLEVYAAMKKPFVVDALVESDFFGFTSYKQSYYDEVPTPVEMHSAGWSSKTVSTEEISKFAQSRGYDGVIIENVREAGGDATTDYIVFKSTQVKHAFNQHGNALREALRAQLPITDQDVARTFTAIKNNRARIINTPGRTGRGEPSIFQAVEVNGYTLYAEQLAKPGANGIRNLETGTIYKAPTLAIASRTGTSPAAMLKRQGGALYKKYSTTNCKLSTHIFVADKHGNAAKLHYVKNEQGAVQDGRHGNLVMLTSVPQILSVDETKSERIETGYAMITNPYIITASNRV